MIAGRTVQWQMSLLFIFTLATNAGCHRFDQFLTKSQADSVRSLTNISAATAQTILDRDGKKQDGYRTICELGTQSDRRLGRLGPVNSGNGALAIEIGALQIAHYACGAPEKTAGPFFDPDGNTFVTLNLPLVMESVDAKSTGGAQGESLDLVRIYSFRDNGVWDDVYAKNAAAARPANVPASYDIYERIPTNGSWLAVGKNQDSSRRVAVVSAPGGLSTSVYVERDGGVFYLSQTRTRAVTDYANEFSIVTSIVREPSGKIAEIATSKVYQISSPPVVEVLAHARWYYANDQLTNVEDGMTGQQLLLSYTTAGALTQIVQATKPDAQPIKIVTTQFKDSRLIGLENQQNHSFAYDQLGRLKSITERNDGKDFLVANICYQFSHDNSEKNITLKSGAFSAEKAAPSPTSDLTISSQKLKDEIGRIISITDTSGGTNKMTIDPLGRVKELVSSLSSAEGMATTTRSFNYSSITSALASSIEEISGDGKKSTSKFEYSLAGEKTKVTVDGNVTYDVKSWFDNLIPKVYSSGTNLIEMEASAAPLTANYRKSVDGKPVAETSVRYRTIANGTAIRIAELVIKDLIKGQVITTTYDLNGTPTRTVSGGDTNSSDKAEESDVAPDTTGKVWIEPAGCGSATDDKELKGLSAIGSKSNGEKK